MEFLAWSLLIIAFATPGSVLFSPETASELGLSDKMDPPPCRERDPEELKELYRQHYGKHTTFSLDGEFVCEGEIFNYGERSTYYDFMTRLAPTAARNAATKMHQLLRQNRGIQMTWALDVKVLNPQLKIYITNVFLVELTQVLGSGSVVRQGTGDEPSQGLISIDVRDDVQDADLVFKIEARAPAALAAGGAGPRVWRL